MKKLVIRTITGVLVLIASLFFTYKGSYFLLGLLLFLSTLALYEVNNVLRILGYKQIFPVTIIANIILILAAMEQNPELILSVLLAYLMVLMCLNSIFDLINLQDVMAHIYSLIYISLSFSVFFFLWNTPYIWLVYICAWGTDTFAYISGSLFGKHLLIPKVSPNKTIEGSIGGIVGVGILGYIFAQHFGLESITVIVPVCILGSVVAQLGDLSASKIKRLSKVKDYGSIFLGHGGVLDRFDSILFTAPYIYIIVTLFL